MPAEQARTGVYSVHVPLTMTPDMKSDLDSARVKDGVELTARVRALIQLWQDDPEIREKADQLAPSMRRQYRQR